MLQGALLHLVWGAWHLTTLKVVLVFECAPELLHMCMSHQQPHCSVALSPHSNVKCHEKGFPFSVSKLALAGFI